MLLMRPQMSFFYELCDKPFMTYLLPPATKLGQGYLFTCVCDSVKGGLCPTACWDTLPWEQTPPVQLPPCSGPPWDQAPPPHRSVCWELRATSGCYASYWNAILFQDKIFPSKVGQNVLKFLNLAPYKSILWP